MSNPKANNLMEKRIGTTSIVINDISAAKHVNETLSIYGDCILARQGLPLHNKGLHIITLIIESTTDRINALNGKLGRLPNVEVKTIISKTSIE